MKIRHHRHHHCAGDCVRLKKQKQMRWYCTVRLERAVSPEVGMRIVAVTVGVWSSRFESGWLSTSSRELYGLFEI